MIYWKKQGVSPTRKTVCQSVATKRSGRESSSLTAKLRKTLALALILIFAGAAAAEDTNEKKTQLLDQFFSAVQQMNAETEGANSGQALSKDEQPAPAATPASANEPQTSNDIPPDAVTLSENAPASSDAQLVPNTVPPDTPAPVLSEVAPPPPVAPSVSDDVPPQAADISEDIPPAPGTSVISEDVPPAPVAPPVSEDVPAVKTKTVDGGYFTVSVPEDWTMRRHSDLLTFLSSSGEARLSVAKVSADGRSVHEFASDRCTQTGGTDLKTFDGGASYNYTSAGGVRQHARIYALPGKEGAFAVTSGLAGETEMQILDSLRVKEEAAPPAVKAPEKTPPAKTEKAPPKRAPREPKEPAGKLKTLHGSHWSMQVPSAWTLRNSGTRATISAPRRASTIVIGSKLSTHGVPLSEIALAQCRRHNGEDFVRLGRGVCGYTTFEGGRRTHVRLYPVGPSQMVQVQITGRLSDDVYRALESLYLW